MKLNRSTMRIECSTSFTAHDLEQVLKKYFAKDELRLADCESLAFTYLKDKLKVREAGEQRALSLAGTEIKGDQYLIFYEIPVMAGKEVDLEFTAMTEEFETQLNLVRVIRDDGQQTYSFRKGMEKKVVKM